MKPSATNPEGPREKVRLATPPLPCLVPPRVFDAFGWATSDWLVWQPPRTFDREAAVCATNPAGMVFVCHEGSADFLPRELAHLHAPRALVGETSWALAPYAIDDATDDLYAHRVRPRDALFLYADGLAGLTWGLHDWAHFHHHGPFTERALTELQCDACALVWLWVNRDVVGIDEATWRRVRGELAEVARARFEEESARGDEVSLLDASKLFELARTTA